MPETFDAIYEHGILRPLETLDGLAKQTRVRVTLERSAPESIGPSRCGGILPDEDAEEMRRVIQAEFEQVNPSEW